MRRLMLLGNCVAQRLASLLEPILKAFNSGVSERRQWQLVSAPPVYNLSTFSTTTDELALRARACDLVFSQPLFNFGPLNTAVLQEVSGLELHTFSAPNFEAYFPDIVHPRACFQEEKFPPPLEWHSRIFLECKAANVPVENVETIYLRHPLFRAAHIGKALEKAWAVYEQREKDVEIGTLELVREFYSSEILFFTWKHPGDRVIRSLLTGMLEIMGMSKEEVENSLRLIPFREQANLPHVWSEWGFGFNAWPVINNSGKFFTFPDRRFFRVAGQEIDILTAAIAWYHYYDAHPEIFSILLKHSFDS